MGQVSLDIQQLIDHLHLPEKRILEMFSFRLNDNMLTEEESIRFIHFLRNELSNSTR